MKTITKLWILVLILIILSPLGLILPHYFKAGPAWGEWKLTSFWSAPLPDYLFKGWETKPLRALSIAYIISALAGIAAVVALVFLVGKIFSKKD